jgi:predicted secreted protein
MAGIKSFGITVSIGGTAIGGLTDVTPGGVDVTNIDVTAHDSTGGWREFVGGLTDGGTLELTGNYDITDAGQLALKTNRAATVATIVTFSDDSTWSFDSVVGGYNLGNPLDDKIEFTCSLKVTGPIVNAAGV